MLRSCFLVFIFSFATLLIRAQCMVDDVTIPSQVCLQSNFQIANNSSASSLEWDFCPYDLQATPAVSKVMNTGLSSTLDFTVVKQDSKFFGFALDANSNSLVRLEFENTLENIPTKMNLGNVNDLFQFPNSIAVAQEGGTWLGLVANAGNSKIILLNFRESLTNVPTATVLHERTSGGFANISVAETSVSGRALTIAEFNTRGVTVLNYPQGFLNAPDYERTVAIAESTPIDIQVFRQCEDWQAFVLSFDNRKLYHLSFGNSITNNPLVSEYALTFGFEPYRLSMAREGDLYHGFVTSTSGGLSRLDFQSDLSINPVVAQMGSFGVLSNSRSLHVEANEGKWNGLMINFSDGDLYRLSFKQDCGAFPEYFAGTNPGYVKYTRSGNQKIAIAAYNTEGTLLISSYQITVTNDIAPHFNIAKTNACVNHEILFEPVDVQGSIADYQWTFGDGNNSALPVSAHVYSTPDNYAVSLHVIGKNSCANEKQIEFSVFEKPESHFLLPDNFPLCTNQQLQFENTSLYSPGSDPDWRWFVNEVEVSDQPNLHYGMSLPGSYDIRLVASIPGCESNSKQTLDQLIEGPAVDFDHAGVCFGDITSFINKSPGDIDSFAWEFDDGEVSAESNPSHNFVEVGNYSVRLTATDQAGCNNSVTKLVTVYSKPVIDFQVYGPPLSCTGTPTQFFNESADPDGSEITRWLWEFHDSENSVIENEKEPQHIFQEAGTFLVSLSSTTESGCEATLQKEISITQSPSTDFTYTPACDDKPVTFTGPSEADIVNLYWEIGSAYYLNPSPTHTFKSPGDYPLYLEVTSSNGCTSSVTNVVHVPVPLSPDFSVLKNCINQEAIFTDITSGLDPVVAREWNFKDNEIYSDSPVRYTFMSQGNKNVTLKVTASSGCGYQVTKQVPVVPSPVAGFSASPSSGAYPLKVTFTNSSALARQYLWKIDGTDATTTTESSPVFTFQQPGTFTVELTAFNEQQCQDSFQSLITTVAPLPDVELEVITLTPNPDGSWKLIVTIHNKGNTILKNLPVDIDFGGKIAVRQNVDVPISPGSKYNLVFKTGILDLENLSYLCASIDLQNDLYPNGNRICNELTNRLFVFPAYPNPTNSTLNVEWIGNSDGIVRISLADALGKQVFLSDAPVVSGLNHLAIDLRGLQDGLYYLLIEDGNTKTAQRISISTHP